MFMDSQCLEGEDLAIEPSHLATLITVTVTLTIDMVVLGPSLWCMVKPLFMTPVSHAGEPVPDAPFLVQVLAHTPEKQQGLLQLLGPLLSA